MKTSRLFFAIISILFLPLFYCSGQIKIINNIHYPASTVFHNADSALAKTSAPSSSDLSDPKIIKPDFIVNSFGGDYGAEQRRPVIAIDSSGNYAAAWLDFRSGNKEIYAQFFDNHDNPIGSNIRVSDNASGWNMDPAIAVNKKGDFIIAWAQDWNLLLAQRFTKNGQKTGGNLKLNSRSGTNISQPSLAVADDGRFLVYWDIEDYSRGRSLCTRMFDPSGNALAEEISIGDLPNQGSSSGGWGNRVAVDAHNNFAVVWSQYIGDRSKICLQRIDFLGQKIGNNAVLSSSDDNANHYFPSVAATDDGTFLIAWESDPLSPGYPGGLVKARLFNALGNFVSDQLTLYAASSAWLPCSVSSDKRNTFFVAWHGDTAAHCQKIQSDGKLDGKSQLLKFNSDFTTYSAPPKISDMVNGQLYVAFDNSKLNDLNSYLQKFNGDLTPSGPMRKTHDDSGSSWQTKPLVCFNGQGGYIVLWEDKRNGTFDLYGQVFDSRNNPVGNNLLINDASKGSWFLKNKSAKALSDGSFAIAFSGSQNSNGSSDIYLRLISPAGEKIGNAVFVANISDYYSGNKIVMNVDKLDNILLVWYVTDYSFSSAFLRQYSKTLTPITPVSNFIKYVYTDKLGKSYLSLSVNKDLNVFAAWNYYELGRNIHSNKINGEIFNNRGVSLSGEMTLDSVSNSGSIQYFTNSLSDFGEKDYALVWHDGSYMHIKRNYFISSRISLSDSFGCSATLMPQIVSFSNRKLLLTYMPYYPNRIDGYYFNDNRQEKFSFPVYQFDNSSSAEFGYHYNNSPALLDNKLVFAYESCRNGLTGFDIWARALQIDNINSKPEWFLKPVNNDVLYPNTPNPFNSSTKISYQIYSYHKVRLAIYDILGREVKLLFDGYQEKGFYEFNFDGSGLPSGIYLCRLETFNTFVNKMLMIK